MNKGNVLFNMKRFDESLACYDKVLSLNADSDEGWTNKANALRLLNRAEEAVKCYDRALQINPNNTDAKSGKAAVGKK
jgi:tetratricopeptide (TPR) repeat protein